jgi:hypothetical protein
MLSPSERARLKELVEKATPGEWFVLVRDFLADPCTGKVKPQSYCSIAYHPAGDSGKALIAHLEAEEFKYQGKTYPARNTPNAELIVTAVNALPALLADLEAAERERDELRAFRLKVCGTTRVSYEDETPNETAERYRYVAEDALAKLCAAERERDALREAARWIPVHEKLPELEVRVLCLLADGDVIVSERENLKDCEYENLRHMHGGFDCSNCNGPDSAVTHWQPLPGQTR